MIHRTTLHDVAKLAGVSRSAAARVLLGTGGEGVRVSSRTGERIRKAAVHLRYTPNRVAQQLRGVASKTLGLIVDTENLPVMSERLFAMEYEASQRDYRLVIGRTHGTVEQLKDYVLDFSGRGVEAIYCLFDLNLNRDERARKAFHGWKKVVFHGRSAWKGGYAVRVNTVGAIDTAIDHLLARGKRRPALALRRIAGDELLQLRQRAFLEALKRHGIGEAESLVWDAVYDSMTPNNEILNRGIEHLVLQRKADAIIASNDIWAVRFILRLKEMGLRIPEDVAVIGYDNLDLADVIEPSLTTIDQCHQKYAAIALDLLVRVARDERIAPSQRTITVEPQLVARHST